MNVRHFIPVGLFALAVVASGADCPTIPQIDHRVVELAVGGSAEQEFVGSGNTTTHDDTQTYDLSLLDIAGILDDAGISADQVTNLKFSGAEYFVTQVDPNPNQAITGGTVTVRRGAGVAVPLVTNFSVVVNSTTSPQTAVLDQQGVNLINAVLADVLASVHSGNSIPNPVVSVRVTGTALAPEDFKYVIRLNLSLTGKVKVDVLN
jgi:hypothetical protein